MQQLTVIALWPRFWELHGEYEGRAVDFHIACMHMHLENIQLEQSLVYQPPGYLLIDMWIRVKILVTVINKTISAVYLLQENKITA
jgi:hypothetical protein